MVVESYKDSVISGSLKVPLLSFFPHSLPIMWRLFLLFFPLGIALNLLQIYKSPLAVFSSSLPCPSGFDDGGDGSCYSRVYPLFFKKQSYFRPLEVTQETRHMITVPTTVATCTTCSTPFKTAEFNKGLGILPGFGLD